MSKHVGIGGTLSKNAHPNKIPLEKSAFARAMQEKHGLDPCEPATNVVNSLFGSMPNAPTLEEALDERIRDT